MTGLAWWTHDSWEMVRRNLIHIKRTPELLLPHPRSHLREFVLRPLSEVAPDFILPNQTQTVRELLAALLNNTGERLKTSRQR